MEVYFVRTENVQKAICDINNSGIEAVLLDSSCEFCKKEIEGAHKLAKMSFCDKTNISKNILTEILLFLSREKHVKNAIEKIGAKSGEVSVLAVFGNKKFEFEKLGLAMTEGEFLSCGKSELKRRIESMALSRI